MSKNSRDDLRIPGGFLHTRSGAADRRARHFHLTLRASHNTLRRLQYEQDVDLLRYTESAAGNPARGVKQTRVIVAGMTGLKAEVGGWEIEEVVVNNEKRRESLRRFVMYDIPRWTSPDSNEIDRVLLTDQLKYLDDTYDIVTVDYHPETGRNVITARLRVSTTT